MALTDITDANQRIEAHVAAENNILNGLRNRLATYQEEKAALDAKIEAMHEAINIVEQQASPQNIARIQVSIRQRAPNPNSIGKKE